MSAVLSAMPGLTFLTLCYSALCVVSPFGNCRKCRGFGYQIKQTRRGQLKRGRYCRRCHATGRRIRLGRHIYNLAARIHREGTR